MLAQSVVSQFGGQASFVVENYGDSELARRLGVKRYPAIFVDDVLVATPKDFGWYGKGEGAGEGRYAPLRRAESHARFRTDLARTIGLLLADKKDEATKTAAAPDPGEVAALPAFSFTDLDGATVTRESLDGKVVIVDFWATWCPPCHAALGWLGEMKKRHGERLVVLALAVESDEADVRELAQTSGHPLRWAMRTPEILGAFGDVSAVPTLLVFDSKGALAGAYYGSGETLRADAESTLTRLLVR